MLTEVHLVKAMVFPVVMCGCESWTIKKAECWRIDVFELWCWNRLLRVPWTARRSNQSILKEISPEYSLEGLMLKLKLQYFGHLIRRTDSLEKTIVRRLKKGWEGHDRRWDGLMASPTCRLEFEQALGVGDGQESMGSAVYRVTKSQIWLSDWTEWRIPKVPLFSSWPSTGPWWITYCHRSVEYNPLRSYHLISAFSLHFCHLYSSCLCAKFL